MSRPSPKVSSDQTTEFIARSTTVNSAYDKTVAFIIGLRETKHEDRFTKMQKTDEMKMKINSSVGRQSALSNGSKTQHPSSTSFTFKHHGRSMMLWNDFLVAGTDSITWIEETMNGAMYR